VVVARCQVAGSDRPVGTFHFVHLPKYNPYSGKSQGVFWETFCLTQNGDPVSLAMDDDMGPPFFTPSCQDNSPLFRHQSYLAGATLPVRVFIGVMPCIISGRAIAVLLVATAAPATGRVLASPVSLLVGGWLWLIGPSGWAHILGEGFLARDASVLAVVVHHNFNSLWRYGHKDHPLCFLRRCRDSRLPPWEVSSRTQ
jgi:hypothetical protein